MRDEIISNILIKMLQGLLDCIHIFLWILGHRS